MKRVFILFGLFSFLFLCSCTPFAPEEILSGPDGLPDRYSSETAALGEKTGDFQMYAQKGRSAEQWWKNFGSKELNGLIDEAVKGNFSVREGWARMLQARYAAVKAGAAKYPELNLQGGAAYTEQDNEALPGDGADEWSLGLTAGYEVDLWGRVRAREKSGEYEEQASGEDYQAAVISISGQVAENWIELISNRKQQQLFESQLRLQKQLLKLITLRFPLAKSTALDIYQQQQAIERIKETQISLESMEEIIKRRIALLAGRVSLTGSRLTSEDFPEIPEVPDPGLPADLLAARPDIRSAGLRLRSTEWEIAAARADRLPALRLTGSHNYTSDQLNSLFDNWLANLAANLAGPVFDGGRREAEVNRVRAVAEERLTAYRRTVFTAVQEVEDALTQERQHLETIRSLREQLKLSKKTIREARSRYLNGTSDFLNVLREELNILQIQRDLITTEEEMIKARIRLHAALGGNWVDKYAADPLPHTSYLEPGTVDPGSLITP